MKKHRDQKFKFAICIIDSNPDLECYKIYQVLPDNSAEKDNYIRIIDESGEDYLYPSSYFTFIDIPEESKSSLLVEYWILKR